MAPRLYIEDPEARALAQELARIERKSLAEAVKEALREKLERLRDGCSGFAEQLLEVGRRCFQLPVLDSKAPDKILGYNETGVPK